MAVPIVSPKAAAILNAMHDALRGLVARLNDTITPEEIQALRADLANDQEKEGECLTRVGLSVRRLHALT